MQKAKGRRQTGHECVGSKHAFAPASASTTLFMRFPFDAGALRKDGGMRYRFVLASTKICQRFRLSSFKTPFSNQGSFFSFSLTSFSSSALTMRSAPCAIPRSSSKGPPIRMKPSSTS